MQWTNAEYSVETKSEMGFYIVASRFRAVKRATPSESFQFDFTANEHVHSAYSGANWNQFRHTRQHNTLKNQAAHKLLRWAQCVCAGVRQNAK